MTYVPLLDARAAEWFVDADVDVWTKINCGPPGFESSVRVFFIDTEERPGLVDDPVPSVVALLTAHSGSDSTCFAALWEGYCGDASVLPPGPTFGLFEGDSRDLPVREYVLLSAPADRLFETGTFKPDEGLFEEAHAVWPADRSWFIAADVDPEWFTVGTTQAVAAEILADPRFDAELVAYGTRMTVDGR